MQGFTSDKDKEGTRFFGRGLCCSALLRATWVLALSPSLVFTAQARHFTALDLASVHLSPASEMALPWLPSELFPDTACGHCTLHLGTFTSADDY